MTGALIAGTATAQDKSESVDSILKELGGYQSKTSAPASAPAVKPVEVTPAKTPAPVAITAPAPVAKPAVTTPVAKPAVAAAPAPAAKPEVAKESKGWKFWGNDAKDTVAAAEKPAEKAPVAVKTEKPADKPVVKAEKKAPAAKPVVTAAPAPAKPEVAKESKGWKFWGNDEKDTVAAAEKPAEKAPVAVKTDKPADKPVVKAEKKTPVAKPEVAVKAEKPAVKTEAKPAVAAKKAEPAPAAVTTAEKPAAKESKGWMFWRNNDAKDSVATKADKPADKPVVKAEKKANKPEAVAKTDKPADKPVVKAEEKAPAAKPEVVAKTDKPAAKADEKPAKVEVPDAVVAALDVPKTLEASRELYAGGEFEQAQKGFEAVVKKEPENVIARMYLRKLLERDPRTAEVQGMKAVNNGWKTDIVLRSYAISADAATKMGLEKSTESADVAMKFPEVKFPKGSSAVYQPKAEKLFVRNTRENLLVLEEILAAMDVAKLSSGVEQVEIEAKFVEVSEGTLEELGFEWRTTLGNVGGKGVTLGDKVYVPEGQYLFDDALRGGPSGPAMPFARPGSLSQGEVAAGAGEWKAFRFEDTFNAAPASMRVSKAGSTPLDILITALDQSTGTDVLSAPRVVTQSGKKATIRAGELHYFPETYEVGGNEGTIIHAKYVDFTEKLLGVELEVTPKVDGEQIGMTLNPKVSELLGWQTYSIVPANSSYSTFQGITRFQFNHDPVSARLPIFKRREIKTEVTIADGATMGMGGLINEKVEKYEDKVPVLGSIPLIGRLFRNEGERAVKRNLLIFVTAKKVEPTGRINTARSFE
jgi:type II secretory pathway component GspD/PulD (secretin)